VAGFSAGSIVAKLTLSKEKWDASIRKVKEDQKTLGGFVSKNSADFKKMGMAMTMAGGVIVASMGLMIKKYVDAGDQIDKMSKRTGFAAETLSELRYAAEISGANIESLEKGVKRMAKTIVDAGEGMATYRRAFDRIGVSVEDLQAMNPEQQFLTIADAIAKVEDPTIRAATAQDVFGRAGTQLLPLFAQGSEGLDDLRQKAHELGIVFDKEAAEKAARLADAQLTLRSALRGVTISIAENLAPALSKLAEDLSVTIAKVSDWIKEHPKLTGIIATSTGIIGGLMVVLGPLAMMLPGIVVALPAIAAGFTAMTGPIGLVTTALALIAIRANDARNAFERMTKAAEMEAKAAGEKISWFKKTVYGLNAAWDKYALGLDTSKLAQAAMNKEIIKAQDNLKKYEPLVSKAKDALKDLAAKGKGFIESLLGIKKASEDTSKGIKILVETGETLITNIGGVIDKSKWLQPELVTTTEIIQGVQGAFSDLSTFIYTTAIPAARDMAGVLDLAVGEMEGRIPDITAAVKTSTEEIMKSWDELHPFMSNLCADLAWGWSNMLVDMLGITESITYQMKEFDNSYWENAKANIDKNLEDATNALIEEYDAKRKHIQDTITDEDKKQAMLEALENQYQAEKNKIMAEAEKEREQIMADEDEAREKFAENELKRQDSLWNKVKIIFGTAIENMLADWTTNFIGGILRSFAEKLIPGIAEKCVGIQAASAACGTSAGGAAGGAWATAFSGTLAFLLPAAIIPIAGLLDKLFPKHVRTAAELAAMEAARAFREAAQKASKEAGVYEEEWEKGRVVAEPGEGYQKGGFVKKTGLAMVHKGEYIIPNISMPTPVMQPSAPIKISLNILGETTEIDLNKPMKDIMIKLTPELSRQGRLKIYPQALMVP